MNYSVYKLSPRETLQLFLIFVLLDGLLSFLFYDSPIAFVLLLPTAGLYIGRKRDELIRRRGKELRKEFRDLILAVSTALSAGYSIENSFREAYKDVSGLYGENSLMCRELKGFFRQIEIGVSLDRVVYEFSERAGIDEIRDFAEIFSLAKRNGGDFSEMIQKTVSILSGQEETEREIEVLLSGKKLEQKIMGVIPLIIILYLRFSTGGFLDTLYHNITGVIIMSVCLVIYVLSYLLAERIAAIKV